MRPFTPFRVTLLFLGWLSTRPVYVPIETTQEIDHQPMTAKPGRRWVIFRLVCAFLALAATPVVFGPLGVVTGMVAVWKGAKWWGTAGVSASLCRL